MANWGLNEVNLRHEELMRRAQQAQRDLERRPEQPVNRQQHRLAWLDSTRVFLERFTLHIHLKDVLFWNDRSPSTTPKRLPSVRES